MLLSLISFQLCVFETVFNITASFCFHGFKKCSEALFYSVIY